MPLSILLIAGTLRLLDGAHPIAPREPSAGPSKVLV
jgi:hypothetical protein